MSDLSDLRELLHIDIKLDFSTRNSLDEVYNNNGPQSKHAWKEETDYRIYVRTRSDGAANNLISHGCTFKLYGGDLNGMDFKVLHNSYVNNTLEFTNLISEVKRKSNKTFSICVKNFVYYNQALLIVYFDAYRPSDDKARKDIEQEFENRKLLTHNYMSGKYNPFTEEELIKELNKLYKLYNVKPWSEK